VSLSLRIEKKEEVLCLFLQGELDHHSAEKVRAAVDEALASMKIRHLVLDLSGLEFMDSSGLGVILGRYKLIQQRNGKMFVCSIAPSIYRLFQMSGIFKIIHCLPDLEEALDQLGVA
jgi:stage II sporulation protein AA (anti-sigma F factor antagonist)